MDSFGIGLALRAVAKVYFQSARGSGRTTALVESVKDGDRIVFANTREADRVRRLCLERGVDVECVVVVPARIEDIFRRGTSRGRTIFDHTWIEERYLQAIERTQQEIDYIERETSGYGEAPLRSPRIIAGIALVLAQSFALHLGSNGTGRSLRSRRKYGGTPQPAPGDGRPVAWPDVSRRESMPHGRLKRL